MPPQDPVHKVMTTSELVELVEQRRFAGSADDLRDGFIHLSTAAQLPGTLARHFADKQSLFLVTCRIGAADEALRYEPSGRGEAYPHLYRTLDLQDVLGIYPIPDERAVWTPPR